MNYKQSNYLMDIIMPNVRPTTFKVICAIARQTWGWANGAEWVTLSQKDIADLTGISSPNTIKAAIDEALAYIIQEPAGSQGYKYSMKPIPETASKNDRVEPETVSNSDTSNFDTPSKNDREPYQNLTPTLSNFDTPSYKRNKKEKERKEKEPPNPPPGNAFPFKAAPTSLHESPADARVAAVLEVCDLLATIPNHLTRAENAAAQIRDVSAGYIRDRYGRNATPNGSWHWYRDDFRGRRGESPKPENVVETISLRPPIKTKNADATASSTPSGSNAATAARYAKVRQKFMTGGN